MNHLDILPLKQFANGPEIPGCFRVHDPVVSALATEAAIEFRQLNGGRYVVPNKVVRPDLAIRYLEMQQSNAQKAAQHLVRNGQIKGLTGDIPIVYPPDGGIASADGFARGIDCFSACCPVVMPADVNGGKISLPDTAIEMAKRTGTLVICDDVIHHARSLEKLMASAQQLPENTNIVIYANHGFGRDPDDVFKANNLKAYDPSYEPQYTQPPPSKARKFNISIYVSDITDFNKVTDLLETADIIAQIDSPQTNALKSRLVRRRPIDRTGRMPPNQTILR